ncbi:hypothetical protein H6784_02805 [Candidatus Nomurabacteria bacterium]|nr:hypothetical protein [Candidatus Kaiserbacteria bacterium]MCB9814326.1 hypothetical protein [Candidatus Nomurabacteria bacterium]
MTTNIKSLTKTITYTIFGLMTGVFLMVGVQGAIAAWTDPAGAPPNPNVAGPLTISDDWQSKGGPLNINASLSSPTGFGLGVGENMVVGGKIYSNSTLATDPGATVVTKDYVDSKPLSCRVVTAVGDPNGTGPAAFCGAGEIATGGGCRVATNGNVTACGPIGSPVPNGWGGSGDSPVTNPSDPLAGVIEQEVVCCKVQ